MTAQPDMRERAVALARKGLYVFRLRPGTKEVYDGSDHHSDQATGKNIPSCDPDVVYKMWTDKDGNPRKCNIGVDTTKGFIVFDIDTKDGRTGAADWKAAIAELGDLPLCYVVQTPSGGYHFYYRLLEGVTASAHKVFGKGIDVRAYHGYVVGAGSVVDGVEYIELPVSDDIPELPPQWVSRLQAPASRAENQVALVELDLPANVEAAVAYVQDCPTPEIGEGNDTVFKIVSRVKDLGVSENACLELIIEHLHTRMPGMPMAMVKKIVRSSYIGNSQNRPGVATPEHEFGDLDIVAIEAKPEAQVPAVVEGRMKSVDVDRDPAQHPVRQWVMHGTLLRSATTALIAPGAAGKSTLVIHWALALVLGRSDLVGGLGVKEPVRVGIINHEDPEDEFYRRLDAACSFHNIDQRVLKDKLFIYEPPGTGAKGQRILVAERKNGVLSMAKGAVLLQRFIMKHKLDVLFIDPMVSTHQGQENDNTEMDLVTRIYNDLAAITKSAVCFVHHTSKPPQASSEGFATSQHAGRGASAIVNAVRCAFNFFPMSPKDATNYNVMPDQRHRYVRLDGVKTNFTLSDGQPAWFEKVSVQHPNGESVGALQMVNFETQRNVDVNKYITAILATGLDFENGKGAKEADVIALLINDPLLAEEDEKALTAKLRKLFKAKKTDDSFEGGQSWDGCRVGVVNMGTAKDYDWRYRITTDLQDE